jgi:DNA-binding MarR family transcriptional regulator
MYSIGYTYPMEQYYMSINYLEKLGLVLRDRDHDDRRNRKVALTIKGHEILKLVR